MLARFAASWLIILILAPFTAPFSICELASLIDTRAAYGAPASTQPHIAFTNATHSVAPPAIVRKVSRVKVLMLSPRRGTLVATPHAPSLKRTVDPPDRAGTSVTATTVLRL
jgi:hypothetical protein